MRCGSSHASFGLPRTECPGSLHQSADWAGHSAVPAVCAARHQRVVSRDDHDTAHSRRLDFVPQRRSDRRHRRSRTARAAVSNDEVMQPPLRIESDESQTPNIDRHRAWTAIARNQAHVSALCESGDHLLLQSNRVESERSLVRPIVIARYEDSLRAGGNSSDLSLESATSRNAFFLWPRDQLR